MGIFSRLKNGWTLGKTSLKTIKENPSLMLFPIISGASLLLVTTTFFGGGYLIFGEALASLLNEEAAASTREIVLFAALFIFYLINYFVIIFFNVGLVHCAKRILEGRATNFGEGVSFALTRIGVIFSWALLAATVGVILKAIQEKAGAAGKVVTGIIGVVWGIATFFVVPIIAYEDVNPIEAVKRSGQMMKDNWGEAIGANFSFGIFGFLGLILIALPIGFLVGMINPMAGMVAGFLAFALIQVGISAANIVFLAAAYQHVNNEPTGNFEGATLDSVFMPK